MGEGGGAVGGGDEFVVEPQPGARRRVGGRGVPDLGAARRAVPARCPLRPGVVPAREAEARQERQERGRRAEAQDARAGRLRAVPGGEGEGQRGHRGQRPPRGDGLPALQQAASAVEFALQPVVDAPPGQRRHLQRAGDGGVGAARDAQPSGDEGRGRTVRQQQVLAARRQLQPHRPLPVLAAQPHGARHGLGEDRPPCRAHRDLSPSRMISSVAARYASAAARAAAPSPSSTAATTGSRRAYASSASWKGPARCRRIGR